MKQQLRRLWFRVFSDHPLTYPGRVLVSLMPRGVLARYQSDFFTGQQSESLVGRIIRSELNRQYYAKSDSEQRRLNRERFWGGQAGAEWHEKQRERFTASGPSEDFLKFRRPLVQQIKELIAAAPRYELLCEIGTGNGLFLQYLSRELSGIKRFVGLDLNRDQIARNRQTYAGSALEFVAGEVEAWIRANVTVPTIFVAVGTLECFTEAELVDLLRKIHAARPGAAVGLCEPINIDLGSTTDSRPRGNTMYSHNYPHLLRSSGYALFRQHVEPIDPAVHFYQMVVVVATTAPVAAPQESFA
jgi:Methyltransferase domain